VDLLANSVQSYPWGSTTVLPGLLGRSPNGEPQAELWVGAHERLPSRLTRHGAKLGLDEVIRADPVGELGHSLAGAARLPFLLKILAVERPLSLQLHPDAASAARGHAAEQAAGLAGDAPQRSFSDPWPKPEMLYAVTDFSAFSGFAETSEARDALDAVGGSQLEPVRAALDSGDPFRAALSAALRLPADDVAAITGRVRAAPQGGANTGRTLSPALAELAEEFPDDPAVVALLLMREVTLAPGETLFVPPGQLHCYLAGTACEVQVSSDNVLRAGLTAKHVDIDGVLELLDTRAGALPPVPVSDVGVERVFQPPVEEFALAAIADVPTPTPLAEVPGPALLMCLQGRYQVFAGDNDSMELGQGEAAYVPARDPALRVRGVGVLLRLTGNRAG